MIRKLNRTDYKAYTELLGQLTEVGSVSNLQFNVFVDNQSELNQTLVFDDDGVIKACLTYFCEQKVHHSFSSVLHIEDVVTDSKYRGQGLAKALINNALKIAKSYNCYKVVLNCNDDNVEFYKKLGFQHTGNQLVIKF